MELFLHCLFYHQQLAEEALAFLLAVVTVPSARIMAAQNAILNDGNVPIGTADAFEQEVVTISACGIASVTESLINLRCVFAWNNLVSN